MVFGLAGEAREANRDPGPAPWPGSGWGYGWALKFLG